MCLRITIPSQIKNCIRELVEEALSPGNRGRFLANPDRDFTRKRKLSVLDIVIHMLSRSAGTL